MNIAWDTIEGSSVELGAGVLSITRTAQVTEIDAAASSDPYVLLRALDSAIAGAGQTAPGVPKAFIQRLLVRPIKATNGARIEVTYEAPQPGQGGGNAVRWYVEDDTTLNAEYAQIDLQGEPLHTRYTPPAGANAGAGNINGLPIYSSTGAPTYKPYPFALNPLRPRRVLSVRGFLIQRPGLAALDAEDCVNDRPWPTGSLFANDKPKRIGCWLCSKVSAEIDRVGLTPVPTQVQLYKVEARFMSKGKDVDKKDRDWADFGVHHDITGRIPVDMTTVDQVKKVKALLQAPYSTKQDHSVNGYTKVGMYPLANFQSAFGF